MFVAGFSARGKHRCDRVEQLVPGRAGRHAKAQAVGDLRLTDQKQALRLIGGQARETRLEAVHHLDAAPPAAGCEDWNPGFAECVDVTKDGSLGDVELLRQRMRGHPPSALQDLQHLQHPRRAHLRKSKTNMTEDVRFGLLRSGHD